MVNFGNAATVVVGLETVETASQPEADTAKSHGVDNVTYTVDINISRIR